MYSGESVANGVYQHGLQGQKDKETDCGGWLCASGRTGNSRALECERGGSDSNRQNCGGGGRDS